MIVVAIVAIVSAFAYPSYSDYVVRAKRSAASSALLRVAERQQQFFMDNKTFAADLTDLGFPANPWVIADDGRTATAGDDDALYSLSLSNTGVTTYTVRAAPLNSQLAKDTYCGSLSLTQAGARSAGGADCWR